MPVRVHSSEGLGLALLAASSWLQQVPEIAPWILEHCNRAVWLLRRFSDEDHTLLLERLVVSFEVVGVKEEEDSAPSLIANPRYLLWG